MARIHLRRLRNQSPSFEPNWFLPCFRRKPAVRCQDERRNRMGLWAYLLWGGWVVLFVWGKRFCGCWMGKGRNWEESSFTCITYVAAAVALCSLPIPEFNTLRLFRSLISLPPTPFFRLVSEYLMDFCCLTFIFFLMDFQNAIGDRCCWHLEMQVIFVIRSGIQKPC